jgi:NAD(P)H-dependent flavin oxidoreductase YrpB (nitropropane dioxygenase family)
VPWPQQWSASLLYISFQHGQHEANSPAQSNAGGLGVIGGLGYTPEQLQAIIDDIKAGLTDKSLPFGVDLALPQVGGSARKTNHDYTHGQLDDLIDVTIKNGAKLFVSAVGVPPKRVIEKLHKAGILVRKTALC